MPMVSPQDIDTTIDFVLEEVAKGDFE